MLVCMKGAPVAVRPPHTLKKTQLQQRIQSTDRPSFHHNAATNAFDLAPPVTRAVNTERAVVGAAPLCRILIELVTNLDYRKIRSLECDASERQSSATEEN